jgi:hypothetical protein
VKTVRVTLFDLFTVSNTSFPSYASVINAWARSRENIAPSRAEQILKWMNNLHRTNPSIRPDKYTYNTGKNELAS